MKKTQGLNRDKLLCILLLVGMLNGESLFAQSGGDAMGLLKKSMATYPTLSSYADSGTVLKESPGLADRYQFKTFMRKESLDFKFDFRGVTSTSAGTTFDLSSLHIVIWMVRGEMESFNSHLQSHEIIPRASGNQPAVLHRAASGTLGTSTLIPALIYDTANLSGTIRQIQQATDAGMEEVDGHNCRKIIGLAVEYYPSGQIASARQVTVWLDADSLLVRKVFEDTPKGYPAGSYLKTTITLEPVANGALQDSDFRFSVPDRQ